MRKKKCCKKMMITREKLKKIEKILGITILAIMLLILILINATEIKKGNAANRTIAGSTYRNVDYFRDFSLETFDGKTFSNENLKEYRITVINIWEPYCSACLKEMPELDELSREYRDKGLQLVAVQGNAFVYPEDVELGCSQIADMGVTLPMIYADEKFSEQILPILDNSFPGTFVVDSEGNILDFTVSAKSKEGWMEYFDSFL